LRIFYTNKSHHFHFAADGHFYSSYDRKDSPGIIPKDCIHPIHELNVYKKNDLTQKKRVIIHISPVLVRSWFKKHLNKNNQVIHYPQNADPCNLNFNRIECGPNQHPLQVYHEPVQQLKDLSQHCRIIVSLNDVPYDF
jgi:hypothetical protein